MTGRNAADQLVGVWAVEESTAPDAIGVIEDPEAPPPLDIVEYELVDGGVPVFFTDGPYIASDGVSLLYPIPVKQGLVFRPETEALVARFTTPPTPERKLLINTLIGSLIDAGVWAKLDCLWLTAAADAQAGRQNWVQDFYNLTTVNSPTFTVDRGYAGNGSSSYIKMGFSGPNSGGKFQKDDAHIGIWVRTGSVQEVIDIGSRSTTSSSEVAAAINFGVDSVIGRITQGSVVSTENFSGVSSPIGHTVATRSNATATGVKAYRDAVELVRVDNPISAPITDMLEVYLCCTNNSGTPNFYTSRQYAAAHIGANLTAQNIADLYNALNTYLQAVGAA